MTARLHLALACLATILVATAAAGCSEGGGNSSEGVEVGLRATASRGAPGGDFLGAEPVAPYKMPDITLEATTGLPFNLITDTGRRITLIFFGYTHCTEVCPLVMSDLTAAYLQLREDVRDETQVLFVTTDPARDTVPVLTAYLQRFDTSFIGLTGDLESIEAAARAMGVPIEGRKTLPSGGYNIGHGAQVVGFLDDEAPVIWTEGTSVQTMVDDVTELAGA